METRQHTTYWDTLSKNYDRHIQRSASMYDRVIQLIMNDLPHEALVLDIGTGTGDIPLRICQHAKQIEALDISPEMIMRAQTKARERGVLNVAFREYDSLRLPGREKSYDVVLMSNVLHVIEQPAALLAEAHRVLKSGGRLLAPTYLHQETLKTKIISWVLTCKGHPIHTRFNSTSLAQFLEHHHFTILHQERVEHIMPLSYIAAQPN